VVDSTNVYWTTTGYKRGNSSTSFGTVMKAPLSGGTPTVLASGIAYDWLAPVSSPPAIAVDDTSVYWVNVGTTVGPNPVADGAVMKVALGGGAPVEVASGQLAPAGIVSDGRSVYWMAADGAVMKVSRAGGTPEALAPANDEKGMGLAIRGADVYWARKDSVWKISTTGEDLTPIAFAAAPSWSIAVDDGSVYWLDLGARTDDLIHSYDATMQKAPVSGEGVRTTIASGIVAGVSPFDAPTPIAVTDNDVYWVDQQAGALMKCRKDGGPPVTVVTLAPLAWAAP
jgi:hypothetical protein